MVVIVFQYIQIWILDNKIRSTDRDMILFVEWKQSQF